MSMYSSANFKLFSNRGSLIEGKILLYRIGQICKRGFHQY